MAGIHSHISKILYLASYGMDPSLMGGHSVHFHQPPVESSDLQTVRVHNDKLKGDIPDSTKKGTGGSEIRKKQGNFDIERYAAGLQAKLLKKTEKNKALLQEVDGLKAQMKELNRRYTDLNQKALYVQERSDKITQELESKMDKGECFENVNDDFSNYNIARRLQTLYDDDWVKLSRMLGKEMPNLSEFERVKLLSALLQRSYQECKRFATRHLCQFLFLEDKDFVPDQQEEIIRLRRQYYYKDSVREKVAENVFEILLSTTEAKELTTDENKQKVKEFYMKFIGFCWVVAISHPPTILNFNVVDKPYEECSEFFKEFSTKKPVEDLNKAEGTIAVVVWPSMELRDKSGCYMKGDVIVVRKSKAIIDSEEQIKDSSS